MSEKLEKIGYAIGRNVAESLASQHLSGIDLDAFFKGIKEGFENQATDFDFNEANQLINQFINEQKQQAYLVNKEEGQRFLTENALKEGVTQTDSGLQFEVLVESEGPKPAATNNVTVHYHGTLINGTVFDSSVQRGQPATFGLNQVIRGWTEGLQHMSVGSKYRFYIPEHLAYGANPHPGGPIQPYSALIFDVELLAIN